jgi:hypothetical protein
MNDLLKNYDYYLFKIQATNITNFLLKKVFLYCTIIIADFPEKFTEQQFCRQLIQKIQKI